MKSSRRENMSRTTFIGRPDVLTLPESRLLLWVGETGVWAPPTFSPSDYDNFEMHSLHRPPGFSTRIELQSHTLIVFLKNGKYM